MQEFFETECTLEELLAYEKEVKGVSDGNIRIQTKFGNKKIENIAYTAYNEDTFSIITDSGKSVSASSEHILFSKNAEIKVKNLIPLESTIETIDGEEKVLSVNLIGKNDLIDIQVEDVHEFYTANGIRSHNSTLSDVIKFAIYGRLDSKKLKDIANRLNKNAEVIIEMVTNKGKVKIERGIEPGKFEVYINGAHLDKAGKKSVQEYLEDEILEMPFYVFSNTLSLSINDFKSFLKMSNYDKKAIIDKIFGLQVLNQMRELVKQQSKKLKGAIDQLEASIHSFTVSLNSSQRELDELEEALKRDNSDKKTKLLGEKKGYEEHIKKCSLKMGQVTEKLKDGKEGKKKIQTSISADRQIINSAIEKVKLYENSQCPVCESDLQTDFHKDLLREYEDSKKEAEDRMVEKQEKLKKLDEAIKNLETLRNNITASQSSAQTKLNIANSELKKLDGEEVDDLQLSSLKKILEESQTNINNKKSEQIKKQRGIAFYGLVEEILGDKGVKQLAIKSILPPLNQEIGKIIKTLGIDHKIVFNEEFDAIITHFGVEVSPITLSTGEMKKVDFAVLLAVIRMMKMKYPSLNLLFLDEIFSSIDGDGQYHILKVLREFIDSQKINIFVISHYPVSYTEFDYKIDIKKENGFSSFICEKIE
jgi:DNA repair exonuclease SbcCD ATPase subunit